jgi:glucose/arabinose dehydrogenase
LDMAKSWIFFGLALAASESPTNWAPHGFEEGQLYAPNCTVTNRLANSIVAPGSCPFIWATGLQRPRGLELAANNDVIVVEGGRGISCLWDANNNGRSDANERILLVAQTNLNHGIAIDPVNGWLYASSPIEVYRWRWRAGERRALTGRELVVSNIPGSGHTTRTIVFAPNNYNTIYVQVGSVGNVDRTPIQTSIRRYPLTNLPRVWNTGEIVADGLRNEVALRFDNVGRLWGIENGVDNLARQDLGGSIVRDNPAEEMNVIDISNPGRFYGYPYCFSEYIIPNFGHFPGQQWAQPDFMPQYTDAWCRDTRNVVRPVFNFGAHIAPLDVIFDRRTPSDPRIEQTGWAAFHGSWNRNPAQGYELRNIRLMRRADNGTDSMKRLGVQLDVDVASDPVLKFRGPGETGTGWIRPVAVIIAPCSFYSRDATCPLTSSDTTGQLVGLAFNSRT